jgi:hypothetical protein
MRLSSWRGLLLAQIALLAFGHSLRGLEEPEPTARKVVDVGKNGIQSNTVAAKISTLKIKSQFAGNTAQAAAAQAATAKAHVEEVYVKTKSVMPELSAIKKVAKSQAAKANGASKDSQELLKAMQRQVNPVIEHSKDLAVQEVKTMLRERYSELADWRHKVLKDPSATGQVAAAKAAAPYFKTMGSFAGSMATYGLEASGMESQAAADAANAKSLASGAEAKREAGDEIGAAQDEEMSKALDTQSQQLAARGAALTRQIASMKIVLPQYANAAHMAAWNAEYAANPDSVPTAPLDSNFAFAPAL